MASVKLLVFVCLFLEQASGFAFRWWRKDYVCSSTCTNRVCPFGFLEKGCPRCECSQNPCTLSTCGPGFRCETKRSECAAVFRCPEESVCVPDNRTVCAETCAGKFCPYGFLERGCPRCQCAENPCKANTCNTVFQECISKPISCLYRNNCPHRAQCVIRPRARNVRRRDCSDTCPGKMCPYGFLTTGCPRCTCAPNPCLKTTCSSGLVCHSESSVCKYSNSCPYVAKCRDTACEEYCKNRFCPFGFLMEGCPRCTCAPDPCMEKTCPDGQHCVSEAIKCRFTGHCPHSGVCRPNVCSDVCPGKNCPFGFKSEGCPRCDCVLDPCSTTRCPIGQGCTIQPGVCEFGTNCPSVPVCRSVCEETTRQFCKYGFLSRGCPRSTCAPNPCQNFKCPANSVCEPKPGTCDFARGCPYVAECKAPAACEASCRKACEYGMLPEGCPRCQCAPNPCKDFNCLWGACVPTPRECEFSTNCPHKASCVAPCQETCNKVCKFGYLNTGCPRCECAPDPCLRRRCTNGAECKTRPVSCPFISGCPHESYCLRARNNHRCLQTMNQGSDTCHKRMQRYYFDYSRRRCVRFSYSGCGGSVNNFSSFWTCFLTCRLVF